MGRVKRKGRSSKFKSRHTHTHTLSVFSNPSWLVSSRHVDQKWSRVASPSSHKHSNQTLAFPHRAVAPLPPRTSLTVSLWSLSSRGSISSNAPNNFVHLRASEASRVIVVLVVPRLKDKELVTSEVNIMLTSGSSPGKVRTAFTKSTGSVSPIPTGFRSQ